MPDFPLPDLGEGLEEAEVIAWRVKPGDRVAVDQVIVEVETAKAVVEVPVPYAGVVAALHAAAGSTISVGQPLLTVEAEDPAAGFREPGVVVPEQSQATANGGADPAPPPGPAPTRSRRGRRRAGGTVVAPPAGAPPARPARPAAPPPGTPA